jgi:hypothetical protein
MSTGRKVPSVKRMWIFICPRCETPTLLYVNSLQREALGYKASDKSLADRLPQRMRK